MRLLKSVLIFACFYTYLFVWGQPIQLHPDNPHYFLYKGQPTVLVTSAEHYGSVINTAFDFYRLFK